MRWFYKDEDQEKGPFTKDEFQNLITHKAISAHTLVRKDVAGDWRPLKEFAKPKPQPQTPPRTENVAPSTDEIPHGPEIPAGGEIICSQCGGSFSKDEVVTFDEKIICFNCKPEFVQKIKEGAGTGGFFRYAGFWVRFGAKIIDWIALVALQWAVLLPVNMFGFNTITPNPEEMLTHSSFLMYLGLQQLIGLTIPAIYTTFFLGRFSATPGKMVCGLKVIAPDGGKISYLRALGRHFAEFLSAIILLIGYIMAAFDTEKKALHDRICSTRVVHK